MIGKAKFAGQMCIKNVGYQLENGVFKELQANFIDRREYRMSSKEELLKRLVRRRF